MHSYDWDDVKYVLAVVDHGSVSAAARTLKVNHATILRRIAVFEDRFGLHLFDKSLRGYALPPENRQLIDVMRDMETAALAVERQIAGEGDNLRGHVRITSTDTFCHNVLPMIWGSMTEKFPSLALELVCTNSHLDLTRMEADITVRPAMKLSDHLDGEHAGELGLAAYQHRGGRNDWIGLSGALQNSVAAKWMQKHVKTADLAMSVDSFLTAKAIVQSGGGKALLPCILAKGCPDLVRLSEGPDTMNVPIWVASHRDLSQVPRIAATRIAIASLLRSIGPALVGR